MELLVAGAVSRTAVAPLVVAAGRRRVAVLSSKLLVPVQTVTGGAEKMV